MTKTELLHLEKAFMAEVEGGLYQTKSKVAKSLQEAGYITEVTKLVHQDRFGKVFQTGYMTTLLGNLTYCQSCK